MEEPPHPHTLFARCMSWTTTLQALASAAAFAQPLGRVWHGSPLGTHRISRQAACKAHPSLGSLSRHMQQDAFGQAGLGMVWKRIAENTASFLLESLGGAVARKAVPGGLSSTAIPSTSRQICQRKHGLVVSSVLVIWSVTPDHVSKPSRTQAKLQHPSIQHPQTKIPQVPRQCLWYSSKLAFGPVQAPLSKWPRRPTPTQELELQSYGRSRKKKVSRKR